MHFLARDGNAADGALHQAVDHLQGSGLSAAGFSQQYQERTLFDGEFDIPDGVGRTAVIRLRNALERDHGDCRRPDCRTFALPHMPLSMNLDIAKAVTPGPLGQHEVAGLVDFKYPPRKMLRQLD